MKLTKLILSQNNNYYYIKWIQICSVSSKNKKSIFYFFKLKISLKQYVNLKKHLVAKTCENNFIKSNYIQNNITFAYFYDIEHTFCDKYIWCKNSYFKF